MNITVSFSLKAITYSFDSGKETDFGVLWPGFWSWPLLCGLGHMTTDNYTTLGFNSFFKKKLIYFNWRIITLQYCSGFTIQSHESAMGVSVFPILNPPSHVPPHTIPLGHPSAPAPSILYHASNVDWQSVSHRLIYMFQCYFLKSSHPRLLPQSPKDCSLYLCLLLSHI